MNKRSALKAICSIPYKRMADNQYIKMENRKVDYIIDDISVNIVI